MRPHSDAEVVAGDVRWLVERLDRLARTANPPAPVLAHLGWHARQAGAAVAGPVEHLGIVRRHRR